MCGICGIISKKEIRHNDLKVMNQALAHRGPDAQEYYFEQNVGFAHSRLSILDLSVKGNQPMHYLDRYVITFNGEIYNYLEIRTDLENLNYTFHTQTDTEVIMAAYDYYGSECLKLFNGAWAFCIYDKQKEEIFISRDRLGKKPLYIYQKDSILLFASEIKAILKHPEVTAKVNEEWVKRYLTHGLYFIDGQSKFDLSSFVDIEEFPPAHYSYLSLRNGLNQKFKLTRYWQIESKGDFKGSFEEAVECYRELLTDSVKIRLRSDVPVGTALGGMDSSIIVHLINLLRGENTNQKQMTFSSVYHQAETKYCDESEFIQKTSQFLNVENFTIEPDSQQVLEEHRKVIYAMDIPVNSSCLSGWHTYKRISQSPVRVTLDGQGADEILGGYLSYLIYYLSSMKAASMIYEIQKFKDIPQTKQYFIKSILLKMMRRCHFSDQHIKNFLRIQHSSSDLNQVLKEDILGSLRLLLFYGDRESMAFSVESRMPFTDYRLIEFMMQVPADFKIKDGWTKMISREAFKNDLPKEVIWRRDKMGWSIPDHYWFNHLYKKQVDLSIKSSEICKHYLKNDISKVDDLSLNKRMRLYNLCIWHDLFF